MQRSNNLFNFFLLLCAVLLTRCANPVTPQGGPKDVTPPSVVMCDPPNLSVKFTETTFRIEFDEFISLKNPITEVFISPPLKHPLESRLRGKSLIIEMEDSLAPNTTYSVTFGKSIVDLTEGNTLAGFTYVFSTGDFVDTLSLQGNIVNAFDLKPQKDVFVELYLNNNDTLAFDSLPLHVTPYYLTKTDELGNFKFQHLQDAKFKLFAIADQNGDLVFNQPSEKIAFYDSLVGPFYIFVPKADTLVKDTAVSAEKPVSLSTTIKADTILRTDSLAMSPPEYPAYAMHMFEESDSIQRIIKATSPMEGMVLLAFRFPVRNLRVVPLNFDSVADWNLSEFSRRNDSVRLWMTRPETDSLIAKIILDEKVLDTIRVEIPDQAVVNKNAKKGVVPSLGISNPAAGSGLNQFKNKLDLVFSYPLSRWDFSRVLLISEKDTIVPAISFADSLKRRITITYKWEETKSYKILIPDSVFFGLGGLSHDTVMLSFRTRGEGDFGNLVVSMNMQNRPGQYIIQLINEKESIIFEERVINGSEKIRFNFMPPGKYKLKAIFDRNRNNHWDTGNYKLGIQPEEVQYYQKNIEIRANWDLEETWN